MVGYNQDMLAQKARELGYAGDMKNFPAFLEQNPMLAQRYLQEQEQLKFQTGGFVPNIEQQSTPAGQKFTFNNQVFDSLAQAQTAQNTFIQQQQPQQPSPTATSEPASPQNVPQQDPASQSLVGNVKNIAVFNKQLTDAEIMKFAADHNKDVSLVLKPPPNLLDLPPASITKIIFLKSILNSFFSR